MTSLRFTLGTLPAPRPTASPQRPPLAHDLSPEEARSVDTIAAPLADPALAASVRRLVTKDFITRRRRAASSARREHT